MSAPFPFQHAELYWGQTRIQRQIQTQILVQTQIHGTMEWTPSCRLFSFKYTVPYIVSAIEVKAFFAHILLFQMTLSLSFIPRILPQSLFLATHPLAPGFFPILSDVCPFLHISLSPLQEDQMYLS